MNSDRNHHGECSSCDHKVYEDCKEWNAENVAEMEAEDAAQPLSDDTNWSPIPDIRGGTDDEDNAVEDRMEDEDEDAIKID